MSYSELEDIVNTRNASIIDIIIRGGCNLRCNQCFAGRTKIADYDTIKIKKIVESNKENKEVFIYPLEITVTKNKEEILELMSLVKQKRVLTNGVMIGKFPSLLNTFKDYGIEGISIGNFEGVDMSTQKALTGDDKTLQYTVEGIKNAVNKGFKVDVYTVASKANYRQAKEIVEKAYRLGAERIRFYRLLPVGEGKKIKDLAMNSEETEKFIRTILLLRKKYKDKIRISLGASFGPDLYSKSTLEFLADKNSNSKYVCYAASPGYMAIEPRKEEDIYYKCFIMAGEDSIVSNKPFENFDVNKLNGKCGKCEYKSICGGGCRAVAYTLTNDWYGGMDVCVTKVREKYGLFD